VAGLPVTLIRRVSARRGREHVDAGTGFSLSVTPTRSAPASAFHHSLIHSLLFSHPFSLSLSLSSRPDLLSWPSLVLSLLSPLPFSPFFLMSGNEKQMKEGEQQRIFINYLIKGEQRPGLGSL